MNAEQLLAHYKRVAEAPDSIERLRRFVLDLAVRGKLLPQDSADEPASDLIKQITSERVRLANCGEIRKLTPRTTRANSRDRAGLPRGWAWSALGPLINLVSGQHLQPNEYSNDSSSGLPYITGPSDFGVDGLQITRFALVRKAVARQGQLLLTVKGSGVGKTTTCDIPEVAISRQLMALTAIGWSKEYLSLITLELADSLQRQARSLIPGIAREDVEDYVFALPPLAEQHRIVAKVDELMALCDRLEAARAQRETTRDRLTTATLARLNTSESPASPDNDAAKASSFQSDARFALKILPALTARPDQIKQLRQTILRLAVRGGLSSAGDWKYQSIRLGDAASLQNGYAFKSEWFTKNGVRLLRNANVSHGTLNWMDEVCLSEAQAAEYERFRLAAGDVVVSLDRPFIVTGTKVARVTGEDLPALLLQRVGRFVLSSSLSADYLFLWVSSPEFSDQIDPGRSNGVPHISSKQVEGAKLLIPPLTEQHRIVAKVDELMSLCDQLEASLIRGENIRSRLLDALLHEALAPTEPELEAA